MTNRIVKNILKNASKSLSHYLPQSSQSGSDETYTHIILPFLTYNVVLKPRFRDLNERIFSILTQKN